MKTPIVILLTSLTLPFATLPANGGSATWNVNPTSSDWNTAVNWTPATVPNGPSDDATFAASNTTGISLSANTTISSIIFNAGASAFSITDPGLSLTIGGPGVINNSGVIQNFVCNANSQGGLISFTGNASAGMQVIYTSNSTPGGHTSSISFFDNATAASASFVANGAGNLNGSGSVDFYGTSTAASSTFTVNGSTTGAGAGGTVFFHEQSDAGSATFTTFGGVSSGGGGGNGGAVHFADTASAANCTITNNATLPGGTTAGATTFGVNATAGNATITNKGAVPGENFGGLTDFFDNSSAGNATITNEGGGGDFLGDGFTYFFNGGNGGNATLINNGGATRFADGGTTEFSIGSNAGNSTLIANSAAQNGSFNGGIIVFSYDSDGGTARVILHGNGKLFVDPHDDTLPITVGSIEGDGRVSLGYRDLVVGSNNLSTTFSGSINSGGGDGTLTKIGRGIWTISGRGSYTAGTYINGGKLVTNSTTGSATGSSPVQVNKGSLAGNGIVGGSVTVGSGRGKAADISPGSRADRNIGTLTIQSSLTFHSDGSYSFQLKSDASTADSVTAAGITIDSAATFNASDLGTSTLSIGTVFIVINNTAATAISGAFNNLPDGSTITVGNNNLQASYTGGDGNDLTLTVVL
jgi:hypothetical protein